MLLSDFWWFCFNRLTGLDYELVLNLFSSSHIILPLCRSYLNVLLRLVFRSLNLWFTWTELDFLLVFEPMPCPDLLHSFKRSLSLLNSLRCFPSWFENWVTLKSYLWGVPSTLDEDTISVLSCMITDESCCLPTSEAVFVLLTLISKLFGFNF